MTSDHTILPTESGKVVTWTPAMLKRFQAAYTNALSDERESFVFDDNEFYTGYAKYLIDYLEGVFK